MIDLGRIQIQAEDVDQDQLQDQGDDLFADLSPTDQGDRLKVNGQVEFPDFIGGLSPGEFDSGVNNVSADTSK